MLRIDFLNVGKGNCTVINFPSGHLSLIDIDNSQIIDDEVNLQDPIQFIDQTYPNKSIFRFVLTHPDLDHMSGINELFKARQVSNFWDTDHDKQIDTLNDYMGPYLPEDWDRYQSIRNSKENPKTLKLLRDSTSDCCWTQDNIKILSPSDDLIVLSRNTSEDNADKYNHISYVIRIEYLGIVILLGGDATKAAWQSIYEHYKFKNQLDILKADVFLAPHHGSENNVNDEVFHSIDPDYVIISVDRGHDYDYSYYKSLANEHLYSTKHNGNISLIVSDIKKEIVTEKNS